MAQQTVNLGTTANDGTGDTLRAGGDKINDNFTELYGVVRNTQSRQYIFRTNGSLTGNDIADLIAGNLRVVSQIPKLSVQYSYPAAWNGPTPNVYLRGDGSCTTDYDSDADFRRAYMVQPTDTGVSGNKIYWVSPNGDNTTGASRATAFHTIAQALAAAGVLTVMVEGGYVYDFNLTAVVKSYNLIGYGDKPVYLFRYGRSAVFTQNATYANVFQFDETADIEKPCSGVFVDKYGIPIPYTEVASIEAVSQNAMSYYTDTTNDILYVNATSAPVNGVDIYATLKSWGNYILSSANDNTGIQVYLENMVFTHSARIYSTAAGVGFVALLNCGFTGGHYEAVLGVSSCDTVFKGVRVAYGKFDNFSYTGGSDNIEIDCVAYSSGKGGGSVQASTAHLTTRVLRIRGDYECATQNSILDVGTGQTINIGVRALGGNVSSCFGVTDGREMWCVSCQPAGKGYHYLSTSTPGLHLDGDICGIRITSTAGAGVVLDTI